MAAAEVSDRAVFACVEERLKKVVYVVPTEYRGLSDGVQTLLDDARWMAARLREIYAMRDSFTSPKEIA